MIQKAKIWSIYQVYTDKKNVKELPKSCYENVKTKEGEKMKFEEMLNTIEIGRAHV